MQQRFFFFYFCAYSYQSTTKNGVFLYFALILTNVLKQSCFPLFSHILTKVLPSRVFFSIFFCPYHKQSTETNGVFLYSCLNSMLTSPKNGVFSIFAPIPTKALPKRVFFLYVCPYSYQSPATKVVCFSIFAIILKKTCPKGCFL